MVKRVLLGFAAVALAGLFVFLDALPAAAVMDEGACKGSGTFKEGGFTVNESESGVVTVPVKDDVSWKGSLPSKPAQPTAYSGKIQVDLPIPFAPLEIDAWSGSSDNDANSGVKKYDIPDWVPRNVELTVVGEHTQGSVICKGHVKIKLDGGVFDSPVGPVSLVLTALSAAGFAVAGMPKKGA